MHPSPLVYVIILNWNRLQDTLDCLASLDKLVYKNYQILVIDNGSNNPEVAQIIEKFPQTNIIENGENLGYAGGNNVGIRWAMNKGAEYLLLLNNDTEVSPNFVSEMVNVMEGNKSIGITGPTIYYHSSPRMIWSAGCVIDKKRGSTRHIEINQINVQNNEDFPKRVDFVTGCAMLIRNSVINTIGTLDERFFAYYEEADFCVRASSAGYEVWYVPQAYIWHKITVNSREDSPQVHYYMTRNRLLFLETINAGPIAWIYTLFFDYLRTLLSWRFLPKWKNRRVHRIIMDRAILDYFFRRFGKISAGAGKIITQEGVIPGD